MTPELRERIEKKAMELSNIVDYEGFNGLATHCLEQEIKVRLEQVEAMKSMWKVNTKYALKDVLEIMNTNLNKQLSELRGVNDAK